MHCVQFKKLKSFLKTTFLANKSQVLLNIKSCNFEKLLHFIHTWKKNKYVWTKHIWEDGEKIKNAFVEHIWGDGEDPLPGRHYFLHVISAVVRSLTSCPHLLPPVYFLLLTKIQEISLVKPLFIFQFDLFYFYFDRYYIGLKPTKDTYKLSTMFYHHR